MVVKWLIALLISLLLCIAGWVITRMLSGVPLDQFILDDRTYSEGTLQVVAELRKSRIRIGEYLPMEFHLRNSGNTNVTVIAHLDGSEQSLRYPLCQINISDAKGQPQKVGVHRRCASLNRIKLEDFKVLKPGEQIPLPRYSLDDWVPQSPGKYSIRYVYDSRGRTAKDWVPMGFNLGSGEATTVPRQIVSSLNATARVRRESNTVELVVEP